MRDGSLFWVWLAEAIGAGNGDFRRLLGMYGTPYDVYAAPPEELERLEGFSNRIRAALSNKSLLEATQIVERCEQMGIGMLHFLDPDYPQALRDIKDPPMLLYYVGKLPELDRIPVLAMVGTRKMSAYGMRTAYKIAYELSAVGVTVVSGMAAGIDGVCAAATLEAGGFPVAVLGCGLDRAYPAQHAPLMAEIAKRGLLLSEYPPGSPPIAYHFPIRNRLISALSQGVIVVEAGVGSGSLITARDAVMQGKAVFAVPAAADGVGGAGAESLLRDGAQFVAGTEDLLGFYQYAYADRLHPERLRTAAARSAVCTTALERYGVLKGRRPASAAGTPMAQGAEQRGTLARSVTQRVVPATRTAISQAEQPKPEPEPHISEPPKGLSATGAALIRRLEAAGKAVSLDELVDADVSYGQALSELTLLELEGYVSKQPGGLYRKN